MLILEGYLDHNLAWPYYVCQIYYLVRVPHFPWFLWGSCHQSLLRYVVLIYFLLHHSYKSLAWHCFHAFVSYFPLSKVGIWYIWESSLCFSSICWILFLLWCWNFVWWSQLGISEVLFSFWAFNMISSAGVSCRLLSCL